MICVLSKNYILRRILLIRYTFLSAFFFHVLPINHLFCQAYTTGINCEQCIPGYYRLPGTPLDADFPCTKCDCDPVGSTGTCTQEGHTAGTCHCKPGYAGEKCELCAPGYRGFPNCELCPCDPRGTLDNGGDCEGDCVCKVTL